MRWVFGFLIVANIAYLVWQSGQSRAPDPAQTNPEEIIDTDAESLELLSEMDPAVLAQKTRAAVTPTQGQTASQQLCWLLGPFREQVSAKQVATRFQVLNIPASLRTIEGITGLDYLVYSGPYVSRADALGKLRMLQELQIDSFLITRGALTDAISYGLFPKRSQAKVLQGELAEMGYQVDIRENKRTEVQQWLVVPVAVAEKVSIAFWQELESDFDGIDRQQKWCHAIASTGNID